MTTAVSTVTTKVQSQDFDKTKKKQEDKQTKQNEQSIHTQEPKQTISNATSPLVATAPIQINKPAKNWFSAWLNNEDKVSTDGKDDGKLSFGDALKSIGKGLIGIVKSAVNRPVLTGALVAAGVAATILTGGAILLPMAILGGTLGIGTIGYGAYKASMATTDGQAKQAYETIGNGIFTTTLAALSISPALKAAQAAGVKSIQNPDQLTFLQSVKVGIKATPEALKVSGLNAKGNALTWFSAIKGNKVIYAHSNATRQNVQVGHQSGGGNGVEAYRVDLRGNSVEEILAKNPGLMYDKDANKYYVATSWGSKSYVDADGYMFVKYGPGDNNAVARADFFDSYVDKAKLAANGTKEYVDPLKLEPGKLITVAKEAPAKFKIVPEGTQYVGKETLAGTVDKVAPKSVLRIDGYDSPYQSTVEFMFKKVQLTPEQIQQLKAIDPEAAAKYGF